MYGKYIFLVVKILYLKRRKFKKLNFLKITSEHLRDPKGQLCPPLNENDYNDTIIKDQGLK